ncbi:hypothetical protein A6B40_07955 [Mannheimia varigena]|uniref:EpsG family protein n=1 Tax=Mannheimia varigena TaxID=85404 RepID=UPI00159E9801|nr:EpsG family protein [Mannheimia varigena]QLB17522.1 hypothetical protein A6B40_07955 [Mannheimia varigena]
MIYLCFGLLSTLCAILYSFFHKRNIANPLFFISFCILFILGAIRYEVGTDYIFYSNYQIPLVLEGNDVKFEVLARELAKLGFALSSEEHYQYIFAIYHFICVFFIFKAIKEQSKILVLSVFVYVFSSFYNFSLNGIRQAMSMGIVLYSMKFIFDKKIVFYVLYVVIASLFHKAAIICLLLIFLNKKTISTISFIIIGILTSVLFILFKNSIYDIIMIIGFYSEYVGGSFHTEEYNITITIYGVVSFIVFHLINMKTKKNKIREVTFYKNINYIILFLSIVMPFIPNGYRLFYMFMPFHIIIFPNMIYYIDSLRTRYMYTLILLAFYLLFFIKTIMITNYGETLPYQIHPEIMEIMP